MSNRDGLTVDTVSRTGPPVHLEWDPDSGVVRTFDPPTPVIVDMRGIDPGAGQPDYASNRTHTALGVRAAGIRFEAAAEGYLLAWIRLYDGQWRGIVSVELASANHRTLLNVTLYVHPDWIQPKNEGVAGGE